MDMAPPLNRPFTAHRMGVAAIALAVLAFSSWIWLAPLNSAIVTLGLVKSAGNRKAVQHAEGGLVKRVLVRNGDSVRAGQPLLELDDVKVDANASLLNEMMFFESLKRDRLDAEQQLAPRFERPAATMTDRALSERAYQRELHVFQARRRLLDEQLSSYQQQMKSVDAEQSALQRQLAASREALRLARDELHINETLANDQFISRARLIALERTAAEAGARLGEHEALQAQAEQRRNEMQMRVTSARGEYQRVASEEFKDSHARVVQLREQLRPAEDAARRKLVLAPASGTVVGLRVNAPGELAPPREALMEIVPDGDDLVIEARVGVDAIKHLHMAQETELRFTTYSSRTTPLVRGQLSYISADAMTDKDGLPHYVIQVRAQAESLRNAGIGALKPGMAAEVYALVASRSVFDFLASPVTDTLRRSMREP